MPPATFFTLRSYSASVVTSTLPRPRLMRVLSGSGPNAANSGDTAAPHFRPPSTAAYSSGTRPQSTNTASPLPTPSARYTLAKRLDIAASSP